jgi:hypothetical protein
MKNVLVVLSGKAQSGKTTSSQILKTIVDAQRASMSPDIHSNRLGDSLVKIYSFATALKTIAREYFGWDGDKGIYFEDVAVSGETNPMTGEKTENYAKMPIPDRGRQLLINIGQAFRKIRPTIWVDYVINKIKAEGATGSDKLFIIDDMRFKNELALAKTFENCVSVRLKRSSQLDINDTSENDLDDAQFDYYIENDGNAEDLKIKMTRLFEEIKLKFQ